MPSQSLRNWFFYYWTFLIICCSEKISYCSDLEKFARKLILLENLLVERNLLTELRQSLVL